jgi:hypothetical protein
MGKLIGEAEAEVEKCAWVCDYYAEETEAFLADQPLASDAGRSMVAFEPLGTLLAIMPWNFPFWQLFRCAAPALAAGNSVLLKHASNVPRCALIVEELFQDAGAPRGFFQTMLIGADQTEQVIADARVQGVSLTGSEATGRKVASTAGRHLKKLVLELGGSDAFVVLDDAGLEKSARVAVQSRFVKAVSALRPGDPLDGDTTLAPMAREDLRDALHKQVLDSVSKGAELLVGDRLLDQRQNPLDQLRLPESFMDHQVTLLMSEFVTRDVQRFILTRPEGFAFEPGQGVELAIDHPDWRGEGRPFTPTSLEEDRVLEFTIKGYPDHEGVTKALHGLQPGAGLIMSEPFGTNRYKGRGVLIAGGAGVTPFIAILRRLARDDGLDGHALLFCT